ncbi:hypothetical protein M877_01125 [Streptomyces niveus NCIMB 11891]|nr:hypothetical protein M877_01125 [Streptomyces niveus NCIMB 11891]
MPGAPGPEGAPGAEGALQAVAESERTMSVQAEPSHHRS